MSLPPAQVTRFQGDNKVDPIYMGTSASDRKSDTEHIRDEIKRFFKKYLDSQHLSSSEWEADLTGLPSELDPHRAYTVPVRYIR